MTQHIERLSFEASEPHEAIEAAIHLGRYQLARLFCRERRVLDAACGEGYGSHFMAERWGAASVEGIDVDATAISRAQQVFGSERVHYQELDVARLTNAFAPASFDLAISLETVEHVPDAPAFLRALRTLVKPDGTVIVSCPNDHWYYRADTDANPFHLRKYRFEEFKEVAERELGPADAWLAGTPATGFVHVLPTVQDGHLDRLQGVAATAQPSAALLVAPDERITWDACSYFVGIWSPGVDPKALTTMAIHPVTMDNAALPALREQRASLAHRVSELEARLAASEREADHLRLRLRAVAAENELLREGTEALRVQAFAHSCYETLERKALAPFPPRVGRAVSWAGRRFRGAVRKLSR